MMCRVALILALAVTGSAAFASDERVFDRSLRKEPTYQNEPLYLLCVFGPKADQRAWMVLDGATLYVDRNGNGDLTDPDDRIAAEKGDQPSTPGAFLFEVGELRLGTQLHKACRVVTAPLSALTENPNIMQLGQVAKDVRARPKAITATINIDVDSAALKGKGLGGRTQWMVSMFDVDGALTFASSAKEAPVVHVDGPLQVVLFGGRPQWLAGRTQDTVLAVGTRGVGPGTFAMLHYDGTIPDDVHPKLKVTFLPNDAKELPIEQTFELKERC